MDRLRLICLVFLVTLFSGGCGASDSALLAVDVRGVVIDPETQSPILFLVDPESEKGLPVWIGLSEARAISLGLNDVKPPRPLTHDLMKNMLDLLHARVERVVISDLKENTYYATLSLRAGRKTWEVDSRPSDAVAIALKFGAPLFLSPALVQKGVLVDLGSSSAKVPAERMYGFAAGELSAEVARYFGFEKETGVIVTEITRDGPADRAGLRKGDILVRLDRKSVEGLEDVHKAMEKKNTSDAMRIDVYRKGNVLSLKIRP
jgi:bifunctional DNase/RNase